VQLAKQLIDGSNLKLQEVALRSGFSSVRRFNDELKLAYGRSPRDLRRSNDGLKADAVRLRLPVRGPYHADWVFSFLEARALPGLEVVEGQVYRRALFRDGEPAGWLEVRWDDDALVMSVPSESLESLGDMLTRVRRIFDLDADPAAVQAVLKEDALLAERIDLDPGLRVPGAWDGFEIAVRAILGQ
jgi:AraC family transcriptional regulator of adaptative response / DNA-3-methyladenine glycosylase II